MAINTAGQTIAPASLIFADGFPKFAEGSVVFDATAITTTDYVLVTVGFIPKYFVWSNDTDRIMNEWREGMAADSAINTVAAGTRVLNVTGGNRGIIVGTGALTSANSVTIPGAGQVAVTQNATAGAILASKTCRWSAWG